MAKLPLTLACSGYDRTHEQGLAARRVEPAELFAPETLERFKI